MHEPLCILPHDEDTEDVTLVVPHQRATKDNRISHQHSTQFSLNAMLDAFGGLGTP